MTAYMVWEDHGDVIEGKFVTSAANAQAYAVVRLDLCTGQGRLYPRYAGFSARDEEFRMTSLDIMENVRYCERRLRALGVLPPVRFTTARTEVEMQQRMDDIVSAMDRRYNAVIAHLNEVERMLKERNNANE